MSYSPPGSQIVLIYTNDEDPVACLQLPLSCDQSDPSKTQSLFLTPPDHGNQLVNRSYQKQCGCPHDPMPHR